MNDLYRGRQLVILVDGERKKAKTAISMVRYRSEIISALFDPDNLGKTAQDILGVGGDIPVVGSLDGFGDESVFLIGCSSLGGKLQETWRENIIKAINKGMDIYSGMHEFMCDDEEIAAAAKLNKVTLYDIRKNNFNSLATRLGIDERCYRVHTVGHDCTVGKMVVSLEIDAELKSRRIDSQFVATGQTGIMVAGTGIPIDCVVSDFLNGAGEQLVRDHQHHDIIVIEGQGSILQPLFSPVTLGLLHGCLPDALILCYSMSRKEFLGTNVKIPPLDKFVEHYEATCRPVHRCKVVGIAVNSLGFSDDEYFLEKRRITKNLGLPVTDVIREGASPLVDVLLEYQKEIGKIKGNMKNETITS